MQNLSKSTYQSKKLKLLNFNQKKKHISQKIKYKASLKIKEMEVFLLKDIKENKDLNRE